MAGSAAVLAVAGTALIATATPAVADPSLPANLAEFANCPVQDTAVSSCVYITTTSAEFKLGSFDLTTTDPIVMQFGLKFDPNTFEQVLVPPANGASLMTAPKIEVPGGLLNIPGTGVGPLAVYAQPELTDTPTVDLNALRSGEGPSISLSVRAEITNPLLDLADSLGDGCYVGSAADPITLNLTTGTTDPPAPNTPISGVFNDGTTDGQAIGGLKFPDEVTVDNAFAAPGAHGCGVDGGLINSIVNAQGDLPSAAGTNSASLTSDIYQVDATTLRNALNASGNKVDDGDFESAGQGPWSCAGYCGVDHGLGNQHTGTGNGWVRYISGWNDIHQDVSVAPNTNYTLTGWIRTSSNNTDGYFGVRDLQTNVISEQKYGNLPGYTELTVNFNSGDRTRVEVYGGVWALGFDTWAQLDDISITAS